MIKISTTILNSKDRLGSIEKLNKTKCDYLHIDIMDETFVPNNQFPADEVIKVEQYSQIPLDIHLMTEDPISYIEKIKHPNIEYFTIHVEIKQNINSIIKYIKDSGYKVGLAISPQTEINTLLPYLDDIDLILIMSVTPGFGGQKFIPETIERLKQIRKLLPNITIEVDGGINKETIELIKPYANIAAVGSYITNQDNYEEAINELKN